MPTQELRPNGGMLYCMEYLEANYDWLEDRLEELGKDACSSICLVASSPSNASADTARGALLFLSDLKETVDIIISKAYHTIIVRVSMVAMVSPSMC